MSTVPPIVGTIYATREGKKVGPIRLSDTKVEHIYAGRHQDGMRLSYTSTGRYVGDQEDHPHDLVAVWQGGGSYANTDAAQVAELGSSAQGATRGPGGGEWAQTSDDGYEALAIVLRQAYEQAATGKGEERHGNGKPFTEQPIMAIQRLLGSVEGPAYQIMKKAQEANSMVQREEYDAAAREFYGVINYAAAAILHIREL